MDRLPMRRSVPSRTPSSRGASASGDSLTGRRAAAIDPETQVAFCRKLGPIETNLTASHEVDGIFRVTFDRAKTATADYFVGNFGWHIDGCTPNNDAYPPMVTMLSAQIVAQQLQNFWNSRFPGESQTRNQFRLTFDISNNAVYVQGSPADLKDAAKRLDSYRTVTIGRAKALETRRLTR